ncbi:uncharacterized protein KGF55_004759 [Candida pseudojiufengensis]|uniref:uncharacterized protein n=1 Tax=Candida pseudojiufengensis TaxID=497109 RepID=UPI0022256A7E|nr:uncharacterized protein KGF55_004759 [Candida pseudojiufengensis]KAI5960466.1 hypothetical protein KGF55_004759 [Candida pseudojiufengensis]
MSDAANKNKPTNKNINADGVQSQNLVNATKVDDVDQKHTQEGNETKEQQKVEISLLNHQFKRTKYKLARLNDVPHKDIQEAEGLNYDMIHFYVPDEEPYSFVPPIKTKSGTIPRKDLS